MNVTVASYAKFEGTEGRLEISLGGIPKTIPASIKDSVIGPNEIHLPKSHPTRETNRRNDIDADHVRSFLDAVKSRKDPIEPVEVGHSTAGLCIPGNIAQLLKRKFTWDPATAKYRRRSQPHVAATNAGAVDAFVTFKDEDYVRFSAMPGETHQMKCLLRLESYRWSLAVFFSAASLALGDGTAPAAPNDAPPRVITPNEFKGTDVERINLAIAAAAEAGCRVVIPRDNLHGQQRRDVWLIDSAILLRSHTTLELDNCRIKLSDRCRDNFLRSANCGLGVTDIQPLENIHIRGIGRAVLEGADHPRATGDSGKTIGGRTYGTDAGVAGESQSGDWRNIGMLLAFVEHFSIQNVAFHDSHCWAISLERCAHGTLRDIDFQSSGFKIVDGEKRTILNQDGINLRLGCHDILIESISGYTGDDLVALTAIPNAESVAGRTGSTMVSSAKDRGQGRDDIRQVILRNVKGYCRGGHHIVRLLNTPGVRMYDIVVEGLIDTSPPELQCRAAVKIGDHNYGGGIAPLGETSRILVNNVISKAKYPILIGGSLADSILNNIVQHRSAEEAVTVASGPQNLRNVTIANVCVVKDAGSE